MSDPRPAKPKLRWYQFSLRSLLIAILMLGVFFGWLGGKVQRIRSERNAVAEIQSIGGIVYYGYCGSVGGGPWPLESERSEAKYNTADKLSSSFALFEGVFLTLRGGVRRSTLNRWSLNSCMGLRQGVGQPARLRNSIIWARAFFASLLLIGSVRNFSCQLSRRKVVSMSAKDGSSLRRYQGRSGNWR